MSLEEVGYAVGELVGLESVKSPTRMNSAMFVILDEVSKVERLVENGVVLRAPFTHLSAGETEG